MRARTRARLTRGAASGDSSGDGCAEFVLVAGGGGECFTWESSRPSVATVVPLPDAQAMCAHSAVARGALARADAARRYRYTASGDRRSGEGASNLTTMLGRAGCSSHALVIATVGVAGLSGAEAAGPGIWREHASITGKDADGHEVTCDVWVAPVAGTVILCRLGLCAPRV